MQDWRPIDLPRRRCPRSEPPYTPRPLRTSVLSVIDRAATVPGLVLPEHVTALPVTYVTVCLRCACGCHPASPHARRAVLLLVAAPSPRPSGAAQRRHQADHITSQVTLTRFAHGSLSRCMRKCCRCRLPIHGRLHQASRRALPAPHSTMPPFPGTRHGPLSGPALVTPRISLDPRGLSLYPEHALSSLPAR